jgi:hypothetical protein
MSANSGSSSSVIIPCDEKSKPIQWTPGKASLTRWADEESSDADEYVEPLTGKATLTQWADEESSDADEYVKNEVCRNSSAATIGEKMFTQLCASSSHTNGDEYPWPDTDSDDDQLYGKPQALSVPYALPLTTLRPIVAPPECCTALAADGRTKLNTKASLFKPAWGSTAATISSPPSEFSRLISAIRRCILSMECTLDLHVADEASGASGGSSRTTTTIIANLAAGGDAAARLREAIKLVQNAVLDESSHLEETVLIGSKDHPFKDSGEGGFSVTVARVPASERAVACRLFLEDGTCKRQKGKCRFYHPAESDLAVICVEFFFEQGR